MLQVYDNCDSGWLDEIVTGDETCVYFFEPARKTQNKAWVPKGGIRLKSLQEIAPPRRCYTLCSLIEKASFSRNDANKERASLANTKECVRSEVKQFYKRARLLNNRMRGIKLLHDNSHAHKSRLVQEYLSEENLETLPHPPLPSDLALCDFVLFSPLENILQAADSTPSPPSKPPFISVSRTYPKMTSKKHFSTG